MIGNNGCRDATVPSAPLPRERAAHGEVCIHYRLNSRVEKPFEISAFGPNDNVDGVTEAVHDSPAACCRNRHAMRLHAASVVHHPAHVVGAHNVG